MPVNTAPFRHLSPSCVRRSRIVAMLLAGVAGAGPAEACSSLSVGSPTTFLGRALTLTYDRILDKKCSGPFDPTVGVVTSKPNLGEVEVGNGMFSYVLRQAPEGRSDNFTIVGMKNNRAYKVTVTVRFR